MIHRYYKKINENSKKIIKSFNDLLYFCSIDYETYRIAICAKRLTLSFLDENNKILNTINIYEENISTDYHNFFTSCNSIMINMYPTGG